LVQKESNDITNGEVIDFGFDHNAFLRSYYSFSKKIFNKEQQQLGYYKVNIINNKSGYSVLNVSFFKNNGVDDSWKTSKPIVIWRKIGSASVLYKKVILDLIEEMNEELRDFLSGKRIMFDWKKNI